MLNQVLNIQLTKLILELFEIKVQNLQHLQLKCQRLNSTMIDFINIYG